MKKLLLGAAAALMVIGLLVTVGYAAWQGRGPGGQVDVNAFRQFQKETLQLRDEAMAKRLELRNEYAKESPDQSRITKLQGELASLRQQIQEAAQRNGLPAWGMGRGKKFGGRGMMGCGGRGGCGDGPCFGGPAATQQ